MEVANRDGSARCESIQERKDSGVDGAPATAAVEERRGQVRKRGRPPRGQVKVPPLKKREEEEDVCFICFDGGKLVLCDRRGCPKAYHPACIKREEAFFRSKAQWNCGWHICSSCEKAAHYMCYTCTFSLCKTCIKDADFFCVRGNKGFCTTCMKVIMLIENSVQGDKEIVPVDFDDKTSWEYLFKMYWVYLKEKLSLTFEELNRAKNTWKGAVFLSSKGESPDELFVVSNNKGSKDSSVNIVVNASKRRKVMKQKFVIKEDNQNVVKANVDPGESTKWASNEPRKKHDTRGPQANVDEYAAIDVHNINLIYLKRNMMGDLTGNAEKFSDNVVGSVVRIRIFSFDQKQDMYKLVQVVGTSKVALPYKVGQRFTNLMIEILNLDKKEAISIDATSNQEFSEDECKCLRESIRCGLANHFTVGEIQKKAMQLREVKLTACLESEILRLSHLHDRTIEKGHRKELKECMEKLQSLNTPEERQRKLQEIPEVHADPSMNPSYEPEEARESNLSATLGNYSFSSNGREPISSWNGNDISKNTGSKLQNSLDTTCEPAKNMSTTFHLHKEYASGTHGEVNQGKNACNSCNCEKPDNEVNLAASVAISLNEQALLRSRPSSVPVADTMTSSLSTEIASSASSIEADKIWHYQDPSGKIQGPFCMVELRKWSTTGFFPSDLRIWMTSETQDDYILLSDALHGQFHKGKASQHNHNLGLKDVRVASVDKGDNWEGKSGGTNSTLTECKQVKGMNWHAASPKSSDGSEFLRGEHCSRSSSWNTNADVKSEEPAGMILPGCSSMGGNNSWSNQLQVGGSLVSPTLSGNSCGMMLQQGKKSDEGQEKNPVMDHENESSHGSVFFQTNWGENSERQYSCDYSGHSSGQNSKSPALCSSPNGWDSNSNLTKSSETSKQHHGNVIPKFSNPIPKSNDVNKLSVGSNVPAQEPGPSWSSASSLAGSGAPHPEVPAEWGRYSPTLERPSVDEWDSNIVSTSLLKLCEAANKALNSSTAQLTDSSTSHPAADASNWQGIGPNEFTSLDEKSVSDLLAEEVDEMELNGMSSPVLIMNCSGEFVHGAKNDCFSPIEVLSPTFDPRKGDALSSTGDFQLSYQTTGPQMNHRG